MKRCLPLALAALLALFFACTGASDSKCSGGDNLDSESVGVCLEAKCKEDLGSTYDVPGTLNDGTLSSLGIFARASAALEYVLASVWEFALKGRYPNLY